jgi:hypothetical protein
MGATLNVRTQNSVYRFVVSDWRTTVYAPKGGEVLDGPMVASLPQGVYGMLNDHDVPMLQRALVGASLRFRVRHHGEDDWTPVRTSVVSSVTVS